MPDFPAPTWIERHTTGRAAVNKENAQHSTGPRTRAGKLRSSLNALTHGLTGRTVLLPSEDPAALLEMHKVKGIPYDPAQDGFVFSSDQIETFSLRLIRLNESRHIEHIRFYAPLARPASI
jgi:hypothetical protein